MGSFLSFVAPPYFENFPSFRCLFTSINFVFHLTPGFILYFPAWLPLSQVSVLKTVENDPFLLKIPLLCYVQG